MSGCTNTDSNSVRMMEPVGHASRHAADSQCLHTSLNISHENLSPFAAGFSMNATWRHVDAPNETVLSYDIPVNEKPSSGSWFHCLQATSHALQPMQTVVSVKTPLVITGRLFRWLRHVREYIRLFVEARHLRALAADPRDRAALGYAGVRPARRDRWPGGAASLAHITGEDLRLVNLRGWIERDADHVVDDVAGDDARWSPVIRHADHVQRLPFDAHWPHALGDHRARLDLGAGGRHRHPVA